MSGYEQYFLGYDATATELRGRSITVDFRFTLVVVTFSQN
jgi:hypothetical protein